MTTSFLRPGDEAQLRQILRESESDADRHRASILLAFEAGKSMREVAEEFETPVQRVLYWRREYLKQGMALFE